MSQIASSAVWGPASEAVERQSVWLASPRSLMAKAKLPIWVGVGNWKQEVLQILLLQTPPQTCQRFESCCRLSLCDAHHRLLLMALDAPARRSTVAFALCNPWSC